MLVCVLCMLLAIAAVYGMLFAAFIFLMRNETVEQTLLSPSGTYEARVINNDQGALGGATIVKVKEVGTLASAQKIYTGSWGEFETMQIYWKDDTCLVINGTEYMLTD